MSINDINCNNQENRQNELKYYYDNDSENVEYEDVDSFSHSREKEDHNEMQNNAYNVNSNNNLINNSTNNITISNINGALANINNDMINSNMNNLITNARSNININLSTHLNSQVHNINRDNSNNINNILESSGVENYSSEMNGNEDNSESNNNNRNFETQLDDIFDQLSYAISSQKQSIKNEKTNLLNEKNKFSEFRKTEINKLEKEREIWKENFKKVESLNVKETDIIDLDIGGTQKITTTRSTLLKYPNSALALMFSGKHNLQKHNNRYFIDRDGNSFVNLINFLRSGKFPVFKDKLEETSFIEELNFWQINFSENRHGNLQFDPEWIASTLFLEQNSTVIRKQSLQHGIVFIKSPLDINNNYIEFKVTMHIPSRGKNHLFIGVVDKSKYKTENLISTFWKDSPSSFYWDVWNTKLIKTDENGIQIGSIGSYGCQCEGERMLKAENETKIGMYYDYKNKSLIFYKNGINQGVAFKNVPAGLTPSLDLWFESGSVEILKKYSPEEKIFL